MIHHLSRYMAVAILLVLTGCSTGGNMQMLNRERFEENKQIITKLGTKQYQGITKDAAMKAMVIAFQKLDIIIDNTDYKTGLIVGKTKGIKPLSYDEFELVKKIEAERAERILGFSSFGDPARIELVYNAFVLESADGVQISIKGRSAIQSAATEVSAFEFPPKWLEISYTKIWNEFNKNLFIQEKTLK